MNFNSYHDFVSSLDTDELNELNIAMRERYYRQILGIATYQDPADMYRPHPPYPRRGFPDTALNGHTD